MSKRHPRRKTTARRFAMLPLHVLESEAVCTLNHAAFRVLVLLAAAYNGSNNGALGVTHRQAAKAGIASRNTLYGALRDLVERGLIEMTFPASRVPPRPTMYAVTWLPANDTEFSAGQRLAAHSYRQWRAAA